MGYPLLKEIPLNLTFLNFDKKNEIAFNFTRKSLLNAARARLARGLYKKFPIKCSTCKTRQVVNLKGNPFKIFPPASIFRRNPFKNFFHLIFFPGKSLIKKFKTHLQFYVKISNKKFSSFFTGKSLVKCFQKLSPKNQNSPSIFHENLLYFFPFIFNREIPLKF